MSKTGQLASWCLTSSHVEVRDAQSHDARMHPGAHTPAEKGCDVRGEMSQEQGRERVRVELAQLSACARMHTQAHTSTATGHTRLHAHDAPNALAQERRAHRRLSSSQHSRLPHPHLNTTSLAHADGLTRRSALDVDRASIARISVAGLLCVLSGVLS